MAELEPNVLAEFNALAQEAAELRRQSYGSIQPWQVLESNRAFSPLSNRLLAIQHLAECHPEPQDDYRERRRMYPTFTSDQEGRRATRNQRRSQIAECLIKLSKDSELTVGALRVSSSERPCSFSISASRCISSTSHRPVRSVSGETLVLDMSRTLAGER